MIQKKESEIGGSQKSENYYHFLSRYFIFLSNHSDSEHRMKSMKERQNEPCVVSLLIREESHTTFMRKWQLTCIEKGRSRFEKPELHNIFLSPQRWRFLIKYGVFRRWRVVTCDSKYRGGLGVFHFSEYKL